jgi:primosomal protein N'
MRGAFDPKAPPGLSDAMPEPALLLPRPPGFAGLLTQPLLAAANRLTSLSRLNGMYLRARRAPLQGFVREGLATLRAQRTRVRWQVEVDPQEI